MLLVRAVDFNSFVLRIAVHVEYFLQVLAGSSSFIVAAVEVATIIHIDICLGICKIIIGIRPRTVVGRCYCSIYRILL